MEKMKLAALAFRKFTKAINLQIEFEKQMSTQK